MKTVSKYENYVALVSKTDVEYTYKQYYEESLR